MQTGARLNDSGDVTCGEVIVQQKPDPLIEAASDLIDACRRGEIVAQYDLFRIYKDRVFSVAMYLCKDAADAKEVTQDVFIKAFANLGEFRGTSKFETWLYRIAVNTVHDHARRWRRFLLLDSEFWNRQTTGAVSAEEVHAHAQVLEKVRSAVASLPERLRAPVVLRYVEDLSYDEIAAVLKCPAGTIAARLKRAHKLLASKLAGLEAKGGR
jgi:RNA polymerase sigma-70 factor (ECF subfamily)